MNIKKATFFLYNMENKKYAGPPLSNILGLILLLFPLLSMYAARKEHAPTYPVQRRPAGLEFPIPVRFLLVRIPWLPTQWSQVIYCFSAYHWYSQWFYTWCSPDILLLLWSAILTSTQLHLSVLLQLLWRLAELWLGKVILLSLRRILCRVSVDLLLVSLKNRILSFSRTRARTEMRRKSRLAIVGLLS